MLNMIEPPVEYAPSTLTELRPVSDGAAAMIVVSAERTRLIKPNAAYLHDGGYLLRTYPGPGMTINLWF